MSSGDESERTPSPGAATERVPTDHTLPAPGKREAPPVSSDDRYRIEREVARGGMGLVLEAFDHRLGRRVALKQMLAEDDDARARFQREVQITARLQHPGIVPVYEAGTMGNGEPFYAMRLLDGRSLGMVAKGRGLEGRLELVSHVMQVADAIAYAHAQGVIHRDLKPDNILLGEFGETMIIDWGLAKDLQASAPAPASASAEERVTVELGKEVSLDTTLTVAGSILGTVGYMSPEQARGMQGDKRSDVYALGAILFWLLSGHRPGSEGIDAGEHARRQPGTPPELWTIVGKATAREPDARYPSAREMADDLRRFLAGQLVASHRYTPRELVGRWLRRNARSVLIGAAALVALIAGGAVSLARIVRSERRARTALSAAQASRSLADAHADITAATMVELWTELGRQALRDADPILGARYLSQAYGTSLEARPALRLLLASALSMIEPPVVLRGHSGAIGVLAFSGDGGRLVTGARDGSARVWSLATGAVLATLAGKTPVVTVAFSEDGARVATGSVDGTARVWDAASGRELLAFGGHDGPVHGVLFSDGDRRLVTSSGTRLRYFDTQNGAEVAAVDGAWAPQVTASGEVVANGSEGGAVLLDPRDGRRLAALAAGERNTVFVARVALDASRTRVAFPTGAATEVWSLGERKRLARLPPAGGIRLDLCGDGGVYLLHDTRYTRLDIVELPAGTRREPDLETPYVGLAACDPTRPLAVVAGRGVLQGIELPEGQVLWSVGTDSKAFAISPDGRWLATGGVARTSEGALWRIETPVSATVSRAASPACCVDITETGEVVTAGAGGDVEVWPRRGGARLRRLAGVEAPAVLRAAPRRTAVAVAGAQPGLLIAGGGEDVRVADDRQVLDAAFSDDGSRVVTSEKGGAPRLWDARNGAQLAILEGEECALGFLSDGRLATAGAGGVTLWSGDGARRVVHLAGAERVAAVAGDAAHVITATRDEEENVYQLMLWDAASGAQIAPLGRPHDRHRAFALSPDGKTAVAGNIDTFIYRTSDGQRTGEIRGGSATRALAFLGEDLLVSGGEDGIVRVWDLTTRRVLLTGGRRGDAVTALRVRNGVALSSHEDGKVRALSLPLEMRPAAEVRGVVQSFATPGL